MRRDIQGLRAIAVVAVLLFHLWPNRVPGGYIGVDVFFVISGFLITSHLLREVDRSGGVRLRDFWARRIRRLLPAALLVLLCSALATVLWVPQGMWPQFMREIAAAALYVENWVLAADSVDYLAAENTASPAQHYWTLSVEEQFYLAWPLLVLAGLFLARGRGRERRMIALVLAAVTIGSLVWSLSMTASNPAAAYFVTQTRAWEFGAGAMLAFLPGLRAKTWMRVLAAWAGVLLIAACSLTLSASTPMPGTAAIFVVIGAMLVIGSDAPTSRFSTTRLMSWRPVQYTGDISYSLYLWHWPLIIIAPWALGQSGLGLGERLAILAASFVLAAVTKTWVEDRFRVVSGRAGKQRRTYAAAAIGAAVVVAGCAVPWTVATRAASEESEFQARVVSGDVDCLGAASMDPRLPQCPDEEVADLLVPDPTVAKKDRPPYPGCAQSLKADPLLRGCPMGTPGDESVPHVAVIGDSHVRALMPLLEVLAEQKVMTAEVFWADACPWATGEPNWPRGRLYENCNSLRDRLTPLLEKSASRFDFFLTTSWADLARTSHSDQVEWTVEAWKVVADQGIPIVALRDNPMPGRHRDADPNLCLARVELSEANTECGFSRDKGLEERFTPFDQAVERVEGSRLIDLSDYYCDAEWCPAVIGGVNVYRDNNHITAVYMRTLAPYLREALQRENLLPKT